MRTTSAVALLAAVALVFVGGVVLLAAAGGLLVDDSAADPPGELEPLWTSNTTTSISGNHHQPAVTAVDGARLVLVPLNGLDEDCRVAALDADGEPVWRHQVSAADCHAHAVGDVAVGRFPGDDSSALVATGEEHVHALDLDSGDPVLTAQLEEFGYSPPAVLGDEAVVVTDFYGNVAAVGSDGTERWNHSIDAYVWARPMVAPGPDGDHRVVVAGGNSGESGIVRGLRADGSEVWTTRYDRPIRSAERATIGDEPAVVVATVDGTVEAVDTDDGTTRWERSFGGTTRVTVSDGSIYVVDDRGTVRRLTPDDGATQWKRSSGLESDLPMRVGVVDFADREAAPVALEPDGRIRVLDPADGSTLATHRLDGRLLAPPTTSDLAGDADDEIVVVTGDGRTVALEILLE